MVFLKLYLENKKAGKSEEPKTPTAEDFKNAKRMRFYYEDFKINTLEEVEPGVVYVNGANVVADSKEAFYADIAFDVERYFTGTVSKDISNISPKSILSIANPPELNSEKEKSVTSGFGVTNDAKSNNYTHNPDGSITGQKSDLNAVDWEIGPDGGVRKKELSL